jgi:diaminopimelate epimerase
MKKISFSKMSGAGNDFIVIDQKESSGVDLDQSEIFELCERRNGIGADGLILISDISNADFEMSYYNADGAAGSLCGNGARCAIKFAEITGRIKNGKTSFIFNDNFFLGEVLSNGLIKFFLNSPKNLKNNFEINAGGYLINASFADTGSPHCVVNISDFPDERFSKNIEQFPVLDLGKELRYHKDFEPGGTNVNFIQIKKNKIFIRTYERGVEDETLACGTGSAAAALIAYAKHNQKPPITLLTRGGEELIVDFIEENNEIKNLSLTGPAKIVFTGEILIK